LSEPESKHRRWSVITSGLLIAILAVVVTFTTRTNFLSPMAVVVVAAVGVIALMLQLRFRYRELAVRAQVPGWLNVVGTIFALTAFFGDMLHIRPGVAEVIALISIGLFGVSGAMVLHEMRKQRALGK
jgi:uncharacterized membrane-anchored protein